MKHRKLTLIHYQDPAHGWIKCSIGLLYGLGIADKISRYSYRRNESVYIEEDGDFFLYPSSSCRDSRVRHCFTV